MNAYAQDLPSLTDPVLLAAMRKRIGTPPQSTSVADSAPVSAVPRVGELPQEQALPVARHALEPMTRDELYAGGANMPRLSAEAAPQAVQGPVTRLGPLPETIQQGQASDNPMVQRSANGAALGAYAPYVQPGPAQEALEASHEPDTTRHGSWNKTKHVLEGIGKGFALGGLGGALVGGISPGTADRAVYRGIERPRLQAEADRERANQQQQLGDIQRIEASTGMTLDQKPTEIARHRMLIESQGQQRVNQGDRRLNETTRMNDQRISRYAQLADRDRKKQVAADYKNGMFGDDPEMLDWAAQQLGIPGELKPQFIRGMMRDAIDGDGNMIQVNRQTGQAARITGEGGKTVASFQTTQEKNRTARTQMLIDAGVSRQQAELQVRKEIEASREAAAMERAKLPPKRGGSRGSLRQRAEGEATPSATPSAPDPRIGKEFTNKKDGKRYEVVGIDPKDGQPLVKPVQ